ncbi:MAG TPA: tyrosine-type recombinase/integrase [Lacunisphaera sp.]|nr:tyrosine-type recombinase/integrase [Lacunisphaera sp.]
MKSRSDVLKLVQAKIRLRHFAHSTEQVYCHWAGRYYDFCLRLPNSWPAERKTEAFLTDLALKQDVAARTQNQALSALLFLYGEVLGKPLGDIHALRAKPRVHERTAPSREQVRALRQAVVDRPGLPARLIVDLLYGCGLRVSEPLELRIKDVLWSENQLVIRAAKGAKDRRVPLPACCAAPLRAQCEAARRVWEADRQHFPTVGVTLPNQLGKKYPGAARSWQWFWVFPAAGHCAHPRTREPVRFHLLHDRVQQAVREAAIKVGLEGLVTPHVLRHAYATHSREPIDTLRQLMGHVSIETTAGYRHPVVDAATNPLDDLLGGRT